ncbi:MAG: hypothetical protein HRT69_16920 [Flavobacteriaceae bacterium]|nr:hypothetical protein [Flavobacteriaceae bacterium]
MRVLLHILIFTCLTTSVFGQINKADLVGNWVKYKAERVDGSKIIDRLNTEKSYLEYNFTSKRFITMKPELEYSIKGKKLSIGKYTKYIIERLKKDTLILAENYPNKRVSELNRLSFVRKQDKTDSIIEVKDGIVVVNKNISSKFSLMFSDYVFKRITSKFSNTKFKGHIIINLKNKAVNTFITESVKSSKRTLEAIKKAINGSYNLWSLKKEHDKIRINFVGKTMSIGTFQSASFAFNTQSYNSVEASKATKSNTAYEDIQLANKFFVKGNNDFEKKKYKSAIKNYTKSYDLDYVLIDAIYNRALVYHTIGNLEKACEDWKHLADLGQKDAMKYLEEYCN